VRAFLLETSLLERLSGPLCDAVCGRTDSQAMLEQVERANLFLVPLDEVRGWWRYHQLFADLLRARLQQQRPDRVTALHHNAAGWYERNGLADDAIGHALAAGDAAWAAQMIERQVDALLLRGERGTLQRWVAALPAELVGSRPRLLLAQAGLALSAGRVEAVEGVLDAAERAFADAPDEPYEPSIDRAASLVANVPAAIAFWRAYLAELRGDADRAIALDRQALAELGEGESVLASPCAWRRSTRTLGRRSCADTCRSPPGRGPSYRSTAMPRWRSSRRSRPRSLSFACEATVKHTEQRRITVGERQGGVALDVGAVLLLVKPVRRVRGRR
jgi:LuxR family transcriptional regulator, maltose regulon positive regulatory protein